MDHPKFWCFSVLLVLVWSLCGGPGATQPPPERVDLTGTVVAEDTGKPVAGARLTLRRTTEPSPGAPWESQATSDAAGQFTFPGAEEGAYDLEVRADGYEVLRQTLQFFRAVSLKLALRPWPAVPGRLLRPDGTPLAGVTATLNLRAEGLAGVSREDRVTTDAEGRYTLVLPDTGCASVRTVVPEVGVAETPWLRLPRTALPDLRLAPAATLRVRVVNALDGAPVDRIYVSVLTEPTRNGWGLYPTDERGEIIRRDLLPGWSCVQVQEGGWQPYRRSLRLEPGGTHDLTICLVPKPTITVHLDNIAPHPGEWEPRLAKAEIWGWGSSDSQDFWMSSPNFTLPLDVGQQCVWLFVPGLGSALSGWWYARPGQPVTLRAQFMRLGTAAGVVYDAATRAPLAEVSVTLTPLRRQEGRPADEAQRQQQFTQTDAEGRFTFPDQPYGRYRLTFYREGYPLQYDSIEVSPAANGQEQPAPRFYHLQPSSPERPEPPPLVAEVEPASPGVGGLNGVVRDPAGAPLAGVDVTAQGQYGLDPLAEPKDPVPEERLRRTDAEGRFAFADLPATEYALRFAAEGYAPLEKSVVVAAGQTAGMEVTLTPVEPQTRTLAVLLRLPDGTPYAGPLRAAGSLYYADGMISVSLPDPDAEGRATLEARGDGPYVLHLQWPEEGFQPLIADLDPARPTELTLVPQRFGALVGQILRPDGEPAAWTLVEALSFEEKPYGWGRVCTVRPKAMADAQGRFRLEGLREDEYRVLAWPPPGDEGLAPTPSPLVRVVGGEDVTVPTWRLVEGATVRGQVSDAEGRPFSRARVTLRRAMYSLFRFEAEKETDKEGRYEFTGVPPGGYTLAARRELEDDAFATQELRVAAGEVVAVDLREPAEEPGEPRYAVAGEVQRPDGTPAAGALVWLWYQDGSALVTPVVTGADGRFVLSEADPEALAVIAWQPGWGPAAPVRFTLTPEKVTLLPPLRLTPPASLRGQVVAPDGATPLPGVEVTVTPAPGSPVAFADGTAEFGSSDTTDGAGRFTCASLGPGPYQVVAMRRNRPVALIQTVPAGTEELRLVAAPVDGVLEGTVVDEAGEPAANAEVWVWDVLFSSPCGRAITDLHGHFRLKGLPRNTYRLIVSGEGWEVRPEVVVTGPEPTPVMVRLIPDKE